MGKEEKKYSQPLNTARIIKFVLGVVVFGLLMGMRPEFESRWTRSLVAGIAGAILAACVFPLSRAKQ